MKTSQTTNYMEWADLEAWRGYEFWSAQVEATLDPAAQFERAPQGGLGQLTAAQKEWKQDVHPF
jgi:hypothetical protein